MSLKKWRDLYLCQFPELNTSNYLSTVHEIRQCFVNKMCKNDTQQPYVRQPDVKLNAGLYLTPHFVDIHTHDYAVLFGEDYTKWLPLVLFVNPRITTSAEMSPSHIIQQPRHRQSIRIVGRSDGYVDPSEMKRFRVITNQFDYEFSGLVSEYTRTAWSDDSFVTADTTIFYTGVSES